MYDRHLDLQIEALLDAYREGRLRPSDVVRAVYAKAAAHKDNPIWIARVPDAEALEQARRLESDADGVNRLRLYGVPFAVKDNIDVAGMITTAACPAFAYRADRSAPVVTALESAGAILVGKTNLDQFATGLVGTRSPYGEVCNAFDERHVSGGSSSGSAVAVALGMASFALGTDTAGSGRVPAGFNNVFGMKPSRGMLSCAGVVPACRSLDCVSVFALSAADAWRVFDVAAAFDANDVYSREQRHWSPAPAARLRVGIPRADQLEFEADAHYRRLFFACVDRLAALGVEVVEVDIGVLYETAALLYGGPWVAERQAGVGEFLAGHANEVLPVIREIIGSATSITAAQAFSGMYQLEGLRRKARGLWQAVDTLMVPTAATVPLRSEVAADPIGVNSRLGRYTNFVNLLDLCGMAVPAGFRDDGLPFGVTLLAPALSDAWLAGFAGRLHAAADLPLGAGMLRLRASTTTAAGGAPASVDLAVVGAHLSGQPLNGQLVERGARLKRSCRTAACYRLFALPGTTPPKPGLQRAGSGAGIEVEVWEMPIEKFGSFVALVPAPLTIGSVELDDGSTVKGFLCEAHALDGAADITDFGGWRAYLQSL